MNMRKLASCLLAGVGALVMGAGVVLCLTGLNAQPKLLQMPSGAQDRAQAFAEALNSGDLEAAGACLYGQPDLVGQIQGDALGDLAWQKYEKALSFQFSGGPRGLDLGIGWDASIQVMDLAAMTEEWTDNAAVLLALQGEAEMDMDTALYMALEQTEEKISSHEVTLKLIFRDGEWWIVADETLLGILAGRC